MEKYLMKDVNGTKDRNLKIAIVGAGLVSKKKCLSFTRWVHGKSRLKIMFLISVAFTVTFMRYLRGANFSLAVS